MTIKKSLNSIRTVSVTLMLLALSLVSVCFAGDDIDIEQQLEQLQALSNNKTTQSEIRAQPIEMLNIKSDSK
ncbi:MAG: hypothetical protein JKX98_08840 [Alcanivoracaceae bacterium]|nr:hypothetical protein [Alcanivoracaceae bacterium]